jgi:hypothetical protein
MSWKRPAVGSLVVWNQCQGLIRFRKIHATIWHTTTPIRIPMKVFGMEEVCHGISSVSGTHITIVSSLVVSNAAGRRTPNEF